MVYVCTPTGRANYAHTINAIHILDGIRSQGNEAWIEDEDGFIVPSYELDTLRAKDSLNPTPFSFSAIGCRNLMEQCREYGYPASYQFNLRYMLGALGLLD